MRQWLGVGVPWMMVVWLAAWGCTQPPKCAHRDQDCPEGYRCVDQTCTPREASAGSSSSGGASSRDASSQTGSGVSSGAGSSGVSTGTSAVTSTTGSSSQAGSGGVTSNMTACPACGPCEDCVNGACMPRAQNAGCTAECSDWVFGPTDEDRMRCSAMAAGPTPGTCNGSGTCVPTSMDACVGEGPGDTLSQCDLECARPSMCVRGDPRTAVTMDQTCILQAPAPNCPDVCNGPLVGVRRMQPRTCNAVGVCVVDPLGSPGATCGNGCAEDGDCVTLFCDPATGQCAQRPDAGPPPDAGQAYGCVDQDGGVAAPGTACTAQCADVVSGLVVDTGASCLAFAPQLVAGTCGTNGACEPQDLAACAAGGSGAVLATCDGECVSPSHNCVPGTRAVDVLGPQSVCVVLQAAPGCSGVTCVDGDAGAGRLGFVCNAAGRCAAESDAGSCGALACDQCLP